MNNSEEYKGDIKGFPREVVEKMLDRQKEQYGVRDLSRFELARASGFTWSNTEEGYDFWGNVIGGENFNLFFEKYPKSDTTTKVRDMNIGNSDYATHKIQPWDIWLEYELNPWDADIVKRVLRKKKGESRRLDYEKIIHVCQERIRQIDEGAA